MKMKDIVKLLTKILIGILYIRNNEIEFEVALIYR